MGLMGLLFNFAVECFNVFAWPLFALVYPLCASIQAIEANSKSNTLKLITYWVCLSLILLYEYAFAKLLEWLPSWPYVKFLIVGCLVIPRFNGSFYVYKHLVHPCLSMKPQNVLIWFVKLKEFLKQDNLLVEVNRKAKETRSDALENHFTFGSVTAFKPKLEGLKVAQKESNDVAMVEKKEVMSIKQVRPRKPDIALSGTSVSADVKEITMGTSPNLPENLQSSISETPWTCAVCQVKVTSKLDLVSHFQGRPHNHALEKLKIRIETSRSNNLPVTPEKQMAGADRPENLHCQSVQFPWICCICEVTIQSQATLVSHLQGTRHMNACENAKTLVQTLKRDVTPASTGKKSNSSDEMEKYESDNVSSQQNPGREVKKQESMQTRVVEPNPEEAKVAQKESSNVTMMEKKEATSTQQVRQRKPDLALSGTCASADVKEITDAMVSKRDFLGMLPLEEIGKCSAGDACQVTPASETNLVSHLQGSQLEDASEKLKANNQTSNGNTPTSVGTSVSLESEGMSAASMASTDNHDKQHSKDVRKMWICSVCGETSNSLAGFVSHVQGKQHIDACEKLKAKEQALKSKVSSASTADTSSLDTSCNLSENLQSSISETPWTCAVCQVKVTSKLDLVSHFQGRPHNRALEKLKIKIETSRSNNFPATPEKQMAVGDCPQNLHCKSTQFPWICYICQVTIQSEATLVSHLQGTRHVNACEKAKTLIQTLKRDVSTTSTGKKSNSSEEMEKNESGNVSSPQNKGGEAKKQENMKSGIVEPNLEEAKVAQKESSDVAMMEKKEATSTQQVRQRNTDLALSGTCLSADVKEITDAMVAGRNLLDMLPSKEVPKDCACGACQVTPASETDLVSHLQGRPTDGACEKLKTNNLTSNASTPTSVGTSASLEGKAMSTASIAGGDNHEKQHSKDVQKMWICSVCGETGTGLAGFCSHLQGKRHVDACEKLKPKEQAVKSKVSSPSAADTASLDSSSNLPENLQSSSSQTPWTCAVCQVKVTSKLDLVSHFQGRPHKGALERLKFKIEASKGSNFPATPAGSCHPGNLHCQSVQFPWICCICRSKIQSESSLVSHLEGSRHLNACENAKRLIQTLKRDVPPETMEKYESGYISSKARSKENMKIGVVEVTNSRWRCTICKIKCSSEGNMDDHLRGSKHLAKARELQGVGGSGLS